LIAAIVLFLAATASAQVAFEDVAASSGIIFELRNGATGRYRQVELMPGGVAALDYDGDGCLDLYFTNGAALPSLRKTGPEFFNRLYKGDCEWKFTDVTAAAGTAGEGYSMGVAAADYDNDGHTDLYIAGVNWNILYRNLGGGKFEDATLKAGVAAHHSKLGKVWGMSPGWLDYDNDGLLDLFIANYVAWDPRTEPRCGLPEHPLYCHPDNYRGLPNQLFRNNGDGTFRDVSSASGIGSHIGKGMGIAIADFDRDGFPDIYVANDSMRSFLFHNTGKGTFEEVAVESSVAFRDDGTAIAGMGADFRDLDNDGLPDLTVTGMINDTFLLYRNTGNGQFEDLAARSGLGVATRQLTGWAAGIYDFDNDGWKDLFYANAHFPQLDRYLRGSAPLANRVFRNLDGRKVVDTVAGPDFSKPGFHRGAAFGDFDNNGLIDVVVTALNQPVRLFRNVTRPAGHWIAFRLEGKGSNRDGLGAEAAVHVAGGQTLWNHASTAVGYASSSDRVIHFGLGSGDRIESVEIRWPGGGKQQLRHITVDRVVDVIQPH
jgi:hypothetical protein